MRASGKSWESLTPSTTRERVSVASLELGGAVCCGKGPSPKHHDPVDLREFFTGIGICKGGRIHGFQGTQEQAGGSLKTEEQHQTGSGDHAQKRGLSGPGGQLENDPENQKFQAQGDGENQPGDQFFEDEEVHVTSVPC
jgi:hypothetical protein